VSIWLKHRHVSAQNGLLDRCRVLLVAGSQVVSQGDRDAATAILVRIRRLESVWRFGNSRIFRICLTLWAIGTAVVLCILTRYLALLLHSSFSGGRPPSGQGVREQLILAGAISMSAPVHALISYCSVWREPWVIDDCGNHLWHLLHGVRSLATLSVGRQRDARSNLMVSAHERSSGWEQASRAENLMQRGAAWSGTFILIISSVRTPTSESLRRSPQADQCGLRHVRGRLASSLGLR